MVIGRDDHRRPVLARPVGAEGIIAATLQETQQFHLGDGGEIADLVEEQATLRRLGDSVACVRARH
jgi:hypothetical protein